MKLVILLASCLRKLRVYFCTNENYYRVVKTPDLFDQFYFIQNQMYEHNIVTLLWTYQDSASQTFKSQKQ
jgi:hypothetical protein